MHTNMQLHAGEAFNTDACSQEIPAGGSEGQDEDDDGLFDRLGMFAPKGRAGERWQPAKQSKWSPIHIWDTIQTPHEVVNHLAYSAGNASFLCSFI